MSPFKDPEKKKQYDAEYRLRNKERKRLLDKEYNEKNKEIISKRRKEKWKNRTDEQREYDRNHKKKRYYETLSESMEKLGGKCVKCGATERLEFDHIDPKNKSFCITKNLRMGDNEKLQEELDKCQLLCYDCHLEKTKQSWLNGEFK
tara:strand:+ start:32 stop:472 length:441 start_codon:yes stop_codon:yes gene_type:complete